MNFLRLLVLAFVFVIPFGTKKFLFSIPSPFENFYTSEYTAAFLFGVDLLVATLVVAGLILFLRKFPAALSGEKKIFIPLSAFFVISAISAAFAGYPLSAWYAFLRLALAIAAGLTVCFALRAGIVTVRNLFAVLAASAVFQSMIAFLQFAFQKNVGLWFLGETAALGPATPGIAAITADGVQYLRAYGTLPHANILAGFLTLGLLALIYFFFTTENLKWRALAVGGMVMVEAGLLLTFSRSGWIVAACGILAALAVGLANPIYRRRAAMLAFSIFLSLALLVGILYSFVASRAALSASEGPVLDRWRYNEMGVALVAARPEGVGIGNQLFYSYNRGLFDGYNLSARGQWQPIHNLYLLMASEIGILGLFAFLAFLWNIGISNLFRISNLEFRISLTMLVALLGFGLFDHFLWDLNAGRLMLWITLGIVLGLSGRVKLMEKS